MRSVQKLRHRGSRFGALLAAISALGVGGSGIDASAATTGIGCTALYVRHTAADDELLCTSRYYPYVSVSLNGGRTFTSTHLQSTVLSDMLIDGAISPTYDSDHTIFLRFASQGLMSSTDGGNTLVPVDPLEGSSFVGVRMSEVDGFQGVPAVPPATPALAVPGGGSVAVVSGAPFPVAGSGKTTDLRFVQLGAGSSARVVAIGSGLNNQGTSNVAANVCTAALACATGHEFPNGQFFGDAAAQPGPAVGLLVITLNRQTGGSAPASVWVSTDGGATYASASGFTRDVLKNKRVWLNDDATAVPAAAIMADGTILVGVQGGEVFASKDRGKTWQLRTILHVNWLPHPLVPGKGRTLYGAFGGFQCSHDGGVHWSSRC